MDAPQEKMQKPFLSVTFLRGSAPLLWKSDANLVKNQFNVDSNPDRLSSVYWARTLCDFDEGIVLNLLRSPSENDQQVTYEELSQRTDETALCKAYEMSMKTVNASLKNYQILDKNGNISSLTKHVTYFNFQWHEEVHSIRNKVKEWFKNDGSIDGTTEPPPSPKVSTSPRKLSAIGR